VKLPALKEDDWVNDAGNDLAFWAFLARTGRFTVKRKRKKNLAGTINVNDPLTKVARSKCHPKILTRQDITDAAVGVSLIRFTCVSPSRRLKMR
jgi:hypothetical protein